MTQEEIVPLLSVAPGALSSATVDLTALGRSLDEAYLAAATGTTGLAAAGGDEISAGIAALFNGVGQEFHGLSSQAAALHAAFASSLAHGQTAYATAESAAAAALAAGGPLQTIAQGALGVITHPLNCCCDAR